MAESIDIQKITPHSFSPPPETEVEQVPQIRLVFMGTPELSQSLLSTLVNAGYNVVAVVTKPDRKAGRKGEIQKSAVKVYGESQGLTVLTPQKLDDEFQKTLKDLKPDLVVVAAYGKILPKKILDIPGLGCVNIHYSLLPRFRGAAPIQNALLFGDTETGVTLMKMDAGLDTGDIIAMQKITIDPDDTTRTLTPKLNSLAHSLTLEALPLWIRQKIKSIPQPNDGTVLCQLIERQDGKIEWAETAESIYNRFRAFDPWPGIFTYWKKDESFIRLKLLAVSLHKQPVAISYKLGEVFQLGESIGVQTGAGVIVLQTLQLEGKTTVSIQDFLNGNSDFIGSFLV